MCCVQARLLEDGISAAGAWACPVAPVPLVVVTLANMHQRNVAPGWQISKPESVAALFNGLLTELFAPSAQPKSRDRSQATLPAAEPQVKSEAVTPDAMFMP